MKLIVAISMPALMLVLAMALAETSPSGGSTSTHMNSEPNTTAESSEIKGGQKFYPDWAARRRAQARQTKLDRAIQPKVQALSQPKQVKVASSRHCCDNS